MWRCRVLSQASMPRTSVLGLLVAVPVWGGVPFIPRLVIVLTLPFPFPQLGRGASVA